MALLIRLVVPVKLERIGVFTFFAISYMKLALDWDDEQIRMVVAEPSGRGLHVRAAAVVSIGESGLQATLAELTQKYALENI